MRIRLVRFPLLILLLAGVLVPAAVRAQEDGPPPGDNPGEDTGQATNCTAQSDCQPVEVEELSTAYAHGQAFYLPCGSVVCPTSLSNVKVTVLPSVAKALGLHSTTIAEGAAAGPVRTNDNSIEETSKSYYFLPLKASAERAMKKKKVRSIEPTASGSFKNPDGSVFRFKATLASWVFPGNCSGQSLHIQRRLTYGGHCEPN
jgi:hypothetical protein